MLKRLLHTVDRWGPALLAVISLSIVIVMDRWHSERIARLEGQVLVLQALNENVQMWQAHAMVLSKRMLEHGIAVPDPPQPTIATKKSRPRLDSFKEK